MVVNRKRHQERKNMAMNWAVWSAWIYLLLYRNLKVVLVMTETEQEWLVTRINPWYL